MSARGLAARARRRAPGVAGAAAPPGTGRARLRALALLASASVAGAQTSLAGAARAELSADTVELGDAFELRVTLTLPPDRMAYFPDTVAATPSVASLGPVAWEVDPTADGGTTLSLSYPLIGFRVGSVAVPQVALLSGPRGADGAAVGDWSAVEGDADLAASLTRHAVPRPEIRISSLLSMDDATQALEPRPADDVVGRSWSRGAAGAALLSGAALLWVLLASALDVLRARAARRARRSTIDAVEAARRAALESLDALPGLGLVEAGRVDEFYGRSSGAVRGYVEHLDAEWGPAYTSTELMSSLERRQHGEAEPALLSEMGAAEVVKFGRLRPDAMRARVHWATLRGWVAGSGTPGVAANDAGEGGGTR